MAKSRTWGSMLGIVAALAVMLLVAPDAVAQTNPGDNGGPGGQGYPGTTTVPPRRPTRDHIQHGRAHVGSKMTFESCGFQPGATLDETWNGQSAGSETADANGCTTSDATFVKAAGSERCPAVEIDGQRFSTHNGENTFTVVGTGSNGETREVVHSVVVECASVGAGDNARGELPLTGSPIVRYTLVGAVLASLGAAMVLFERRRLARRTA